MERKRTSFEEDGINIAALSFDSVEVLQHFAKRKGIGFSLLSDPDSKVIRAFGILNENISPKHQFYGIPHPGQYLIGKSGVVKAKFFEENYTQRFTAGEIAVRYLGKDLDAPRTQIETDHLALSSWASDEIVAGGQRVALVLDIDLKEGMHVYAPGIDGYIPVDWTMEEVSGLVNYSPSYPESEKLHLPAIEEIVPVYQGSVRFMTDIKLGRAKDLEHLLDEQGQLLVRGELRYQACDDKICYLPATIPLEWAFQLEAGDRTRVPEGLRRNPPKQSLETPKQGLESK